MKPRFSRFATAGLAALTAAATIAMVGGTAAHAAGTTPPYEPTTPNEVGTLSFLDSTGAPVLSGSTTATPFATYAVGNTTINAGDNKAALYACLPQEGMNPALWPCDQLSAITSYPVAAGTGVPTSVSGATTPVATQTSSDETLAQFAASFPNTATDSYAGLYQLRLRTSTGSNSPSTNYDAADVSIDNATKTFQVVYSSAQSTTTVVSAQSAPTVGGTATSLTATVTPAAAGTVEFFANGTDDLGGAAVNATTGVATLSSSSIPVGTDSITATFTPTDGASFLPSTSAAVSYTITATASGPGSFVSVTPDRILDTRNKIGVTTSTPVKAGGTVNLQVTGKDGIPAGAAAVVMNVTATNEQAPGLVKVYPGTTQPTVSSINYQKGVTLANAVIVPLTSTGSVTLFTTAQANLLADVSGYIAGGTAATPEIGGFVGVTPKRLLDTRNKTGVTTTTPVGANQTITLDVTSTGSPVPPGAAAVVLNVTAVNEQAAGLVKVYPGSAQPLVSSINYQKGVTLANAVIVPLTSAGTVTFFTSAQANLLADVSGYISGGSTIPTASGAFVSVTPTRLLDTRVANGVLTKTPVPANTTIAPQITGRASIPGGAAAAVLNVTAVNEQAAGLVKVYPGTTQPLVSTINYQKGVTLANAAIASLSSAGTVTLFTSAEANLLADVSEYIIGS